jgi:hypothetical protein
MAREVVKPGPSEASIVLGVTQAILEAVRSAGKEGASNGLIFQLGQKSFGTRYDLAVHARYIGVVLGTKLVEKRADRLYWIGPTEEGENV